MSQYTYQPAVPVRESNGLGVAGFVISLIGLLLTGGLISPIGLVLSLVALGRRPRGFAVAGVIVGLLGSFMLIMIILVGVVGLLALAGLAAVGLALSEPEKVEITSDMANMTLAIKAYEHDNRYLPADLGVLDLKSTTLHDPWGNPYQYVFEEESPGFDLISHGEDGRPGTPDDVRLTQLGEAWEAGGLNVSVDERDDGGKVTITIGDRTLLTAEGDDEGGRVTLDLGDRVIEIVGDEDGGHIGVVPEAGASASGKTADAGAPAPPEPPATRPD